MSKVAIILGAKSVIAKAIARCFAANGYDLHLIARTTETLLAEKSDLQLRYHIKVRLVVLDVFEQDALDAYIGDLAEVKPRVVVSALGQQEQKGRVYIDDAYVRGIAFGNYIGPVIVAEKMAGFLARHGGGYFVGLSSVTGDRGRSGNYLYGSSKAGYTTYLSGLRSKYADTDVHIITVKLGVIRTPLTLAGDFPKCLLAAPETVAKDLFLAIQNKRNVIYTPWPWRWVMFIICAIPEFLFRRMNF